MRGWLSLVVAAAASAWSADAGAFHGGASFRDSANLGGGGGIYFTGAPRWRGWDCSVCHVDAPGRISVELASTPAELFAEGRYQPGTTYRVEIRMLGEHLGGGALANRNTFVMEIADAAGAPVAGYSQLDAAELKLYDRDGVIAAAGLDGRETWSFAWTAPPAGRGRLELYLGVVDADGAGDSFRPRTDPLGDDVFVTALALCEGAASCDLPLDADPALERNEDVDEGYRDASYGCRVGGAGGRAGGLSLALATLALALAVAARRRRPVAACLLPALLALGCNHDPVLPLECRDRVCGDASIGPAPIDAASVSCAEDWSCSAWEAPLGSDQATRVCTDANGVGTTECKPSEGPVTLPPLDLAYFQCEVEPILDRGCSMQGCHGTETGRSFRVYARGRLRNDEIVQRTGTCIPATGTVNLAEAGSGTVMCEGWLPHTELEWKKNFDSARSFMLGLTDAEQSELLLQPVVGGRPHVGVHLFTSADPDYQTIRAWLGGATLPSCDPLPN